MSKSVVTVKLHSIKVDVHVLGVKPLNKLSVGMMTHDLRFLKPAFYHTELSPPVLKAFSVISCWEVGRVARRVCNTWKYPSKRQRMCKHLDRTHIGIDKYEV